LDSIEYIAEVLPDGHLSLPTEISGRLNLKTYTRVRISIQKENAAGKNLKRFCGKWQDIRDAEEIVGDILHNREKSQRSENVCL
jgi:hypothetical protein